MSLVAAAAVELQHRVFRLGEMVAVGMEVISLLWQQTVRSIREVVPVAKAGQRRVLLVMERPVVQVSSSFATPALP